MKFQNFLGLIVAYTALIGCSSGPDFSKLNKDPRCLHPRDIVAVNQKRDNREVLVQTFSFDDREFLAVYNRLGDILGYRDVYGTELTNADIEAIGPYVNKVNKLSLYTGKWESMRSEFLKNPKLFPNAGKPYKALPRPSFCDIP